MKWIESEDVLGTSELTALLPAGSGRETLRARGVPRHLAILVAQTRDELPSSGFASIPFYSLCRGLLIPLSGMTEDKAASVFGVQTEAPVNREQRDLLLDKFWHAEIGLDVRQKLGCLLGDPFAGKRPNLRRESLLRVLSSVRMVTRRELLERLAVTGDVAILYAESRPELRSDPALTSAEVLSALALLPQVKRNLQLELVRSLLLRCGKVEAFFLAKLIIGGAGLRYEGEIVARLLAGRYGVEPEQISQATALRDVFEVAQLLEERGAEGLREIQLQPLVAIRPALASGGTESISSFPVWVERKYDGIRLMLHKVTDRLGSVLCGAYSRNRRDYLELVRGIDVTIKWLPASSCIIDGELYGLVVDAGGARPASVYEVMGSLRGERALQLRYAAFDVIYYQGEDMTARSLADRRQLLSGLVAPLESAPLALPISLAEGQLASSTEDVNKLYRHFRSQGYEGIVVKNLQSPYRLAMRDPEWRKRKPEVTIDLVLIGAVLAVTSKEKAGVFGSYVLAARDAEKGFVDVGDVAGLDQARDAEVQQLIMAHGLLTGVRIERASASGTRPGFELSPHIVVTIRFAGVVRDPISGALKLREPKLAVLRPDKTPAEADTLQTLDGMYLKQSVG